MNRTTWVKPALLAWLVAVHAAAWGSGCATPQHPSLEPAGPAATAARAFKPRSGVPGEGLAGFNAIPKAWPLAQAKHRGGADLALVRQPPAMSASTSPPSTRHGDGPSPSCRELRTPARP